MRSDENLCDASREDLIDEIIRLREQVSSLQLMRSDNALELVQREFGLTKTAARALLALADGKPKSRIDVHNVMYFDRNGNKPTMKNVDVTISNLRKDLPAGLGIVTDSIGSYVLTGDDRLSRLLKGIEMPCMQNSESEETSSGRRHHGEALSSVLNQIRSMMRPNGVAKFTSREIAARARISQAVAPFIENLALRRKLTIRDRPRRGRPNDCWCVYVRVSAR